MPETTTTRERPILFSGPMVKAILAGTKTQTRRLIQPRHLNGTGFPMPTLAHAESLTACIGQFCPYGVPGDRLWVRETWCLAHPDYHSEEEGLRKGRPVLDGRWCHYAATDDVDMSDGPGWRPSIFMPRWASRLTLEVLAVRVQRLQDTSDEDIQAEGIAPEYVSGPGAADFAMQRRLALAELWDKINGKRAPWASNPWVWVVTFKRLEASDA